MSKESLPELLRYETTLHGQKVTVRRFESAKYVPPTGSTARSRYAPRELDITLDDLTEITKELDTVSLAEVLAEEEAESCEEQ
jgi:hypothetical protein